MQLTASPTRTAERSRLADVATLELQAQYTAGAVMLALIDSALIGRLAVPHWEIGQDGTLTGTLEGPSAFVQLDAWRRILPGRLGVSSAAERCGETRWTIAATVREISVHLVAVGPATARTAVSV